MATDETDLGTLLRRAYRYALALAHDVTRAEDLVQDAVLAVVRRNGRVQDVTYLLKTIRNRFIDLHRREHLVVMRRFDDVDEGEIGAAFDEPVPEVDKERLEQVLGKLRPAEREALYLHCVEGYTAREIGGLTGQPRNTVLSLLHRGRARAREHYSRLSPGEAQG